MLHGVHLSILCSLSSSVDEKQQNKPCSSCFFIWSFIKPFFSKLQMLVIEMFLKTERGSQGVHFLVVYFYVYEKKQDAYRMCTWLYRLNYKSPQTIFGSQQINSGWIHFSLLSITLCTVTWPILLYVWNFFIFYLQTSSYWYQSLH